MSANTKETRMHSNNILVFLKQYLSLGSFSGLFKSFKGSGLNSLEGLLAFPRCGSCISEENGGVQLNADDVEGTGQSNSAERENDVEYKKVA